MLLAIERGLAGDDWAAENPQEYQRQVLFVKAILQELGKIGRETNKVPNRGIIETERERMNREDLAMREKLPLDDPLSLKRF